LTTAASTKVPRLRRQFFVHVTAGETLLTLEAPFRLKTGEFVHPSRRHIARGFFWLQNRDGPPNGSPRWRCALHDLNLELLSDREREILDLAINGSTDQQIANALNITPSTVNSYWVRIRGKVGHLSRTELVSRIVQHKASEHTANLTHRIRSLEAELARAQQRQETSTQAELYKCALDAYPEALVVLDDSGQILFRNAHFSALLHANAGEEPDAIQSYFILRGGDILEFIRTCPHRKKLGLDIPLFGVHSARRLLRVFLVVGKAEFEGRSVSVCIVRPFSEEIETIYKRAEIALGDLR
jgi:DNA-binding CsgD family transcriptional regulator